MYTDVRVKIPEEKGKVTKKKIRGTTYIYYQIDRVYNPVKKYSIPKSTPIGKACEDDQTMMIPNEKYLIFYPEAKLPEVKSFSRRSACLRVGAHMVLKRIIAEYHLDVLLGDLIGKDSGLFWILRSIPSSQKTMPVSTTPTTHTIIRYSPVK